MLAIIVCGVPGKFQALTQKRGRIIWKVKWKYWKDKLSSEKGVPRWKKIKCVRGKCLRNDVYPSKKNQ